jgi:CDP-diacylglycerol--glycerol-3-phosphate 3-phosphatidyltransferase
MSRRWLNFPNLLSAVRFVAAPFLLLLAWTGHAIPFLVLLALALMSDAVDGFVARRRHETSELGTRLDSWGDLVTFVVVPVCAWWLWPEIMRREAPFVGLAMAAYLLPPAIGLVKFGRLTSYHTWAAKLVAVLMAFAVFALLIADLAWPFRAAVLLLCLSAIEEITITMHLGEARSNVRSYWHVVRDERGPAR